LFLVIWDKRKSNKFALWGTPWSGFKMDEIIKRNMIKWPPKFSVIFSIIFIHAWWKKLYLLIRKMCVFFSFWRHIQYLFQWKGENTEKKKNHIFVAPTQWIFSCTYALLKMKLNQNKIVNNIEKGNYHHRTPHPLKLQSTPYFEGVPIHPQSYFFVDKHTITSLKKHTY